MLEVLPVYGRYWRALELRGHDAPAAPSGASLLSGPTSFFAVNGLLHILFTPYFVDADTAPEMTAA